MPGQKKRDQVRDDISNPRKSCGAIGGEKWWDLHIVPGGSLVYILPLDKECGRRRRVMDAAKAFCLSTWKDVGVIQGGDTLTIFSYEEPRVKRPDSPPTALGVKDPKEY